MERGTVIADRLELKERAAEGGMGYVYRAYDRLTGRDAAIKALTRADAEHEGRFLREIKILAEFRHPCIVSYIDHGRLPNGEPFLAMEWLAGSDLYTVLKSQGLTVADTVLVLTRAAEALGAIHARGMVHRDVKPSNLFWVDGEPSKTKLLDFGVAHLGAGGRELTRTGVLVGTPSYMPPEQARGEKDIDARADVFSLGCIAYRCLTGTRPFDASDIIAAAVKLLIEDPPRVDELRPEIHPALADLVTLMLTKDRQKRPVDGNAVAHALKNLPDLGVLGEPPQAARSGPLPSALTHSEQRVIGLVLADTPLVSLEKTAGGVDQSVAECFAGVAAELVFEGMRDQALELCAKLEQLCEKVTDPMVLTHLHYALSKRAQILGDVRLALFHQLAALEAARQREDLRELAFRMGDLGNGYLEIGALESARQILEEAAGFAKRLRLTHEAVHIALNLGWTLFLEIEAERRNQAPLTSPRVSAQEKLVHARALMDQAASEFARMKHARLEAGAYNYIAILLMSQGAYDEAHAAIARALGLLPPADEQIFSYASRAVLLLREGKNAEALSDATVAKEMLELQGGTSEGEMMVYHAYAEACMLHKKESEATQACQKALEVLERACAKITDLELRSGFVRNVPDANLTLGLAARFGLEIPALLQPYLEH
jgi:tetratricopeptide (TPR) repeat protein